MFPARDGRFQAVEAAHDELIFASVQIIGNIARKGRKTALMIDRMYAIHPNVRFIINGVKTQESALALVFFLDDERAAVPNDVVLRFVADPARFIFIGKRYVDALIKRNVAAPKSALYARVFVVKRKLPFAVQGLPMLASELRTRICLSNLNFHPAIYH